MRRRGEVGRGILTAAVGLWILSDLIIILVVGLQPAPSSPSPAAPARKAPSPAPLVSADPLRPALPPIRRPPSVKIRNRGSDTMIELAQAWAEEYRGAVVEVAGLGSAVGIRDLIEGKVDIANSTRPVTEKEIEEARRKTGKEPTLHLVGYDVLAICVHRDNPREEITLDQLEAMYGEAGKMSSWSQLGVRVPGCQSDKLMLVSRQNNCGAWEFFREHVLGKEGRYKRGTIDLSGSRDVVALVGKTSCAIGYAGGLELASL